MASLADGVYIYRALRSLGLRYSTFVALSTKVKEPKLAGRLRGSGTRVSSGQGNPLEETNYVEHLQLH